jgi:glycosyltransferase involved in cell wall biosynthesis
VDSMRVLHLTKSGTGGAFVAAHRISESLRKIGHDSRVEVLADSIYRGVNISRFQARIDFANEKISSAAMTTSIIRSYSSTKKNLEEIFDVDVVNLHWIPGLLHQTFIEQLRKVNRVVWTMHDMNVFTGICHHSSGCRRFEKSCQPCPQFVLPQIQVPASVLREKKKYLDKLENSSFIAPSEWLKREALASDLLRNKTIDVVANPTSNSLIERESQLALKAKIGLTADKPIFAILGANYGEQKGGKRAFEEIIKFKNQTGMEIQIVILGEKYTHTEKINVVSTLEYPLIAFEDILQLCDLYIHLSELENLPNIIIEAQSLGVPVVALDRGGVSETIMNGLTGFLMKDSSEFHDAITWFLNTINDNNLESNIRSFARNKFEPNKIAKAYLEIYSC